MVLTVRCFLCGEPSVRLIMGGRQILHARCQACHSNVLAEVLALEQDAQRQHRSPDPDSREREITADAMPAISRDAPPESKAEFN